MDALTRDHVNNFWDTSTPIHQTKSLVGTYTGPEINEIVLQRAGIENVATVISRNRLRWFGHVAWQGIRISSERSPKNYSNGSRRTEKDPETNLASLGLIVSRKITTLLLDVTPMSKI